ncbi:MAG: hypothetical protein LBT56_02370 [Prevotellaceae bacterium]|jgi:hypothetical protein|nr:hypothetical protein [Prevotellaceae bacterium]
MKNQKLALFFLFWTLIGCSASMEQKIEKAISNQIERYPKSTLQDIYKNFYQARFGAEHAIPDKKAAEDYLMYELSGLQEFDNDTIVEMIGWEHNFVRVPLALVKNGKIAPEELLTAFLESATAAYTDSAKNWVDEWNLIVATVEKMNLNLDGFAEDKEKIAELLRDNPKVALHHSRIFGETYHPHYRIVEKSIYKKHIEKLLK